MSVLTYKGNNYEVREINRVVPDFIKEPNEIESEVVFDFGGNKPSHPTQYVTLLVGGQKVRVARVYTKQQTFGQRRVNTITNFF